MKNKLTGKWLNISVSRYHYYPDLIEFDNDKMQCSVIKPALCNRISFIGFIDWMKTYDFFKPALRIAKRYIN